MFKAIGKGKNHPFECMYRRGCRGPFDLERLFGPTVAHELHRMGTALARALRGAMTTARQGADLASGRSRSR